MQTPSFPTISITIGGIPADRLSKIEIVVSPRLPIETSPFPPPDPPPPPPTSPPPPPPPPLRPAQVVDVSVSPELPSSP